MAAVGTPEAANAGISVSARPDDFWVSRVEEAFRNFDISGTGSVDRKILAMMLTTLGPDLFDHSSADLLLSAFDGKAFGPIHYAKFLEWCSESVELFKEAPPPRFGSQADSPRSVSTEGLHLNIQIRAKDGTLLTLISAALYDTVHQLKQKIRTRMVEQLACDGLPVGAQRLAVHGLHLGDGDLLADYGAAGPDVSVTVQLERPPPLSVLDFACIVAGSGCACYSHSADRGPTESALQELELALSSVFNGRDVNARLQEQSGNELGCGPLLGVGSDDCGPPLWFLPRVHAHPSRLAVAAQWLLAHGARAEEACCNGRSAVDECFLHGNEAVLRVFLRWGISPPTWEQIVQGLVTISHGLSCIVHSDLGFSCGEAPLDELGRVGVLSRLDDVVAKARGVFTFLDMLRCELLPSNFLPDDLFMRAALIGGAWEQEVTLGGPGNERMNFLLVAAHSGHFWALAELVSRGLPWRAALPREKAYLPAGFSSQKLAEASSILEQRARIVVMSAELRMAILKGDMTGLRSLLAVANSLVGGGGGLCQGWSEGLIITAVRCGSSSEVLDVLLSSPRLDPNIGRHDYRGQGCFQLCSPLGQLASSSADGCVSLELVEGLVERLVAHPSVDLEFGQVSGHSERAECRLETPAFRFHQARMWNSLLCLLRAGASVPTCGAADPRLAMNGGQWAQVDKYMPAWDKREWLDSLDKDLVRESNLIQEQLKSLGSEVAVGLDQVAVAQRRRYLTAKISGARRLSLWLQQVRQPLFNFAGLAAYPTPFRQVASALRRGLVERPAKWLSSPLPLHALERLLSFLGFWEFPAVRPSYLRELRLRRVDGLERTCGYVGCPVYDWEVVVSDALFRLGDWAEEVYKARGTSFAAMQMDTFADPPLS